DERGAEGGEGRRASRTFGVLLKWGDDLDAARARYQELAERAGGRGDDGSLPLIHLHLADIELRAGSWAASAEHAERGHEAAGREREPGWGRSGRRWMRSTCSTPTPSASCPTRWRRSPCWERRIGPASSRTSSRAGWARSARCGPKPWPDGAAA